MKKQRLAKQTECPACHKRYALKTIYGGASVVPIGEVCKHCDWSNLIPSHKTEQA